ncbi:protein of unknown function [Azospirillum baldaniorum]|uniref:Uncharacterized protein n=1 Tax=Azospirillum baldaniorum TaxID=1064539 RepID=A0A9P1JS39_9PROT|nr:protein of unknown function [Azospirillum baldaniorum]
MLRKNPEGLTFRIYRTLITP